MSDTSNIIKNALVISAGFVGGAILGVIASVALWVAVLWIALNLVGGFALTLGNLAGLSLVLAILKWNMASLAKATIKALS